MQRLGNGSLPVFPSAEEPQGGETAALLLSSQLVFFQSQFQSKHTSYSWLQIARGPRCLFSPAPLNIITSAPDVVCSACRSLPLFQRREK